MDAHDESADDRGVIMAGYFQDDKGNKSLNRVLTFWLFIIAAGTALAGLVAAFLNMASGMIMITTGLGVAAGAIGLKNWGKGIESK